MGVLCGGELKPSSCTTRKTVTVVLLEDNVGAVTREMVKEKYGVVTRERIGRVQFYNGASRYRGLSRDRSRDQPTDPLQ